MWWHAEANRSSLQAAAKSSSTPSAASAELHYARKMFEAGALKLEPPQNVAAFVADMRRWGEFGMIPRPERPPHSQPRGGRRR
jgi:fatty-acyl-CoA synthase